MDERLISALKAHKFTNGSILSYAALNDENDKTTPTDVANTIYKTFKSDSPKNQQIFLDAIFDGVYQVIFNRTKKKFALLKDDQSADLKVTVKKGTIEFSAEEANFKIRFNINTPEVVEAPTEPQIMKQENDTLSKYGIEIKNKNLGPRDYIIIAKLFENMAKTS